MSEKQILLVEDDEDQALLMGEALRIHGVTAEIARARDGEEALRMLFPLDGNGHARPSVVFLDLHMPKMNGFEVLQHIRSQEGTRMLPVVIFSSSVRAEDVRNAYLSGANSYVKKITSFKEFSTAVGLMALYWLNLNEPAPAAGPAGPFQ
jgi:two-component system response regulator